MADCEFLERCVFFKSKMASMPSTGEVIKMRYCKGTFSDCSRYLVRMALGPGKVPEDLFPNHAERARELIAKA